MNESPYENNHLVGFFPSFFNLAEAGRGVMIAKRYKELGGKVIIFSHGGKYEFLARENGFQIINVNPTITEEKVEVLFKALALETFNPKILLDKEWILENIEEEIKAFIKTGIKVLVSTNNLTSAFSARAAKIPYININSGPGFFALKIPDSLENPFTYLIPQSLKIRILNWLMINTKLYLKTINNIASTVGIPPFNNPLDLYDGDITLVTNNLEFINIFPNQQQFPSEDYIGIILIDELFKNNYFKDKDSNRINEEIITHLKKPGKSILVSLGSSGSKELFIKILKTLNNTKYNVIAIHTSILNEKELTKLNDNILLKKYVPSISKVTEMVDLAIIHGGQGTVFSTVYAKKPIIGYPMQIEQHINLEKIVGHGSGLMLSKKYFSEKKLIKAINEIFNNYSKYLACAQTLANKLPPANGDKKAALKILDVVKTIS